MPVHVPPRARHRTVARALLVAGAAAAVSLVPALAAQAHVTVHPDTTAAGAFAELTFRVPNESASAGTVTVAVSLPTQQPLVDVSVRPVPGWTATVTTAKLPAPVELEGATVTEAPSTVTWSADAGNRIGPGEYQDFAISAGPLPASGEVTMPARQTYSDGTVVDWSEPMADGAAEPEHPAPTFTVTAAGAGDAGNGPASAPAQDGLARWLGGAALVVAVIAAAAAALGLRRRANAST